MKRFLLVFAALSPLIAYTQGSTVTPGQDLLGQDNNPITVAVPFLIFAPDSRGSAMGDVGVATSPDVYSIHWNMAKLAFIEDDMGFSLSYSPWLGNIVDDMSLNYLTFFRRLNREQTIGASLRYFDMGELALTDENNNPLGLENPSELAVDAVYSRKLTENLGVGVGARFIWSNLSGQLNNAAGAKAGTSVSVDLGVFYTKPIQVFGQNSEFSAGMHISNIGQKITYSTESNEDFIPGNLRIGTAFKTNLDAFNSITVAIDVSKLLVPTPPIIENNEIVAGKDPDRSLLSGTFGSFGDAPNGFEEELQELMYSFGLEYWYKDIFAVRGGYFYEHENKGNRKYFTAGVGFRYQVFGVDFSYLIPRIQNHPLADTLRLSFLIKVNKGTQNVDTE